MRLRWFALVALAGCKCSSGAPSSPRHEHAPVDPELGIAIVIPRKFAKITAGDVHVEARKPGLDAAAWGADIRRHAPQARLAGPDNVDGGLAITADYDKPPSRIQLWYRSLGELGIDCYGFDNKVERIARKGCYGTQVLPDGVYVPFALDPSGVTPVYVALEGEKFNESAMIYTEAYPHRARTEEQAIGDHVLVERGDLSDGWWVLAYLARRDHYEATARRTIAGLDVTCSVSLYGSEARARRGLGYCFALEATGDRLQAPPPPPDAPPPIDAPPLPTSLAGPPDGEALARAFVEAAARADEPAMRELLITPEINRAFYSCVQRSDYPVDDRVRKSMAESMKTLEVGKTIVRDDGRIELGAWKELNRIHNAANASVTSVCRTNLPLDVVIGELAFTVVSGARRTDMVASVLLVEALGSARISDVSFR